MKSLRLLTASLALSLLTAASAWAADASGKWTWTFEGPQGGKLDATATFTTEGSTLKGTIENRAGEAEIKDGTIKDDTVSFKVVRKIRRRSIETAYTGKLEGDTIKGTVSTKGRDGEMKSVPWTAQRKS